MPVSRVGEKAAAPESARSLGGVELLESLTPAQLQAVERRCAWRKWQPGEQIIDRETLGNDVYFVVRGKARVVDYSTSGNREVIFDELDAGTYFGELAAIDGEPRSANIVAVEETVTASLPAEDFINLLFDHRDIGIALTRRLSEMVRNSTVRIMDLSTLGAHNRIYAELLRLARTGGGAKPNTASIHPVPVHSDIAARVSTTRETVARVLSELSHRDLVHREGDALVIHDLNLLTNMVHKFKE
jgi:CRP/FNR family cyclic AMP-dependent transcriptional regulator